MHLGHGLGLLEDLEADHAAQLLPDLFICILFDCVVFMYV